jgi:hypothetical protein
MIDPNGRWCGETHRRNRTNRHGCRASDDETSVRFLERVRRRQKPSPPAVPVDACKGLSFELWLPFTRQPLRLSYLCGVIKEAMASRALTERLKFPCEAARLNHMCACT